jgi:hypothetical protein
MFYSLRKTMSNHEHIETPTGTYELRHVQSDYWVVFSPLKNCPVGTYDTAEHARKSLNRIRMGDPLLEQPRFDSLEQIVVAAQHMTFAFEETSPALPLMDRLLEAAMNCRQDAYVESPQEVIEEMRTLICLAQDVLRIDREK